MRKLIIAAMCGVLVVSLTACGPKKSEPEMYQPAVESATPSTDASTESTESAESTESTEESASFRSSPEIREATAMNPMFQFGDTDIIIGSSLVGDLLEGEAKFDNAEIGEETLAPGLELDVDMLFGEDEFTVTAKNDTKEETSIRNSVISAVYANQGPFFGIGGIKAGDPIDELTLALGQPFDIEEGESSYSDITAYKYASQYDDTNVIFFVSETEGIVVSFYETMPVKYITSAADIPEKSLMELIEKREAPSYLTNSPYMLDIEGSDHAVSTLSDVTWTSAKVYALNEDSEVMTPDGRITVNYLVLEYEGRLDYNEEDIKNLSILNSALEPSYNVYGCFYLTNVYLNENGRIISDEQIHELDGVYADEELMLEKLMPEGSYFSADNYDVSETSLS